MRALGQFTQLLLRAKIDGVEKVVARAQALGYIVGHVRDNVELALGHVVGQ